MTKEINLDLVMLVNKAREEERAKENKRIKRIKFLKSVLNTIVGTVVFSIIVVVPAGIVGAEEIKSEKAKFYSEYCRYDKANDEFVKIADGEAWKSPKGANIKFTDGHKYYVQFCDNGTYDFHDDWIRQISYSK